MMVKFCGIVLLLGFTLVLRTQGYTRLICHVCTTENDGADCDSVEARNTSRFSADCPASTDPDFQMSCMTTWRQVANTYERKCFRMEATINLGECSPRDENGTTIISEKCAYSICSTDNCNGKTPASTGEPGPPTDAPGVELGPVVPRCPETPNKPPQYGNAQDAQSQKAGASWNNPSKNLIFWLYTPILILIHLHLH